MVEITILRLICCAVFLVLLAPQDLAQNKAQSTPQAEPTATPVVPSEPSIPLPQVAPRADKAILDLHEVSERLANDPTAASIERTLRTQEGLLNAKRRQLDELIEITPTRIEIQDTEQEWVAQRGLYENLLKRLTERARAVEEDKLSLAKQQAEWTNTLQQIQDPAAIETVYERIRSVLAEIQNTTQQANAQLTSVLRLQDEVSRQNAVVVDALRKISHEKARLQRGLLDPDSPPLWKAPLAISPRHSLDIVKLTFRRNLTRTSDFFTARPYAIPGLVTLFLAALVASLVLCPRARSWIGTHPDPDTPIEPFKRPVSLAFLIVVLVILPMMSEIPAQVRGILVLLTLVPVMRLLGPLIKPVFRKLIYLLVIFGMSAWFWEAFVASATSKRFGLVLLLSAAIAIGAWFSRKLYADNPKFTKGTRLVFFALNLSLGLLVLALAANVFGYVGLARVLRSGAVLGVYSAVLLYTAYIVVKAIHSILIAGIHEKSVNTLGSRSGTVILWSYRLLCGAGITLWIYLVLNFFTIREPVMGFIWWILRTPIRFKAASFALEDILSFIFVFVAGIFLAGILRVVLKENVLDRMNLRGGIPYAISTIIYYVTVLAVFLFALSSAGIELTRLTILTGAFGLGAGFGLQNVISNFVSGIILLFERPVRIGDFLEVDNAKGELLRMGMRSSSIRTPQGAEVIVPNSLLTATQVVNWTLTGNQRRTELQVKVAYGADPEKVSRVLVDIARAHPEVSVSPRPEAFLLGFGDNSLDFELWYWVPRGVLPARVTSQIAMKVAHAFREEGIEVPVPRRELKLTSVEESPKDTAATERS